MERSRAFLEQITEREVTYGAACCKWPSLCKRTKKLNREEHSLYLKHVATWPDTNLGIFHAAVIHMGIPFEPCGRAAYIAVGKRRPFPVVLELVNGVLQIVPPEVSALNPNRLEVGDLTGAPFRPWTKDGRPRLYPIQF